MSTKEMGLLAWDAAWLISDPPGLRKMTTLVELTLQGRHHHAAWRHRGASWAASSSWMDGGTSSCYLVVPFLRGS